MKGIRGSAFPAEPSAESRYPAGERRGDCLRFRWKVGDPLPADEVCCFYAYREVQGKSYLLLHLDENGVPYCAE